MATPGKGRGSAIPGPSSRLPTPGRPRSTSTASSTAIPSVANDEDAMSRAFADAIRANDPAQHRTSTTSDAFHASSSSKAPQTSFQSGRRSTTGRPSSVTSTSAGARTPAPRSKTPVARPSSRASDVFARSTSRTGRIFDVGDDVRIESLGFEGTLRYIGEIDGKPGLWAGIELSGGFAGKGKNDGSVAGKHYFSCPDECGVFVATTKLSAPTTGAGGMPRPSSVASSRSGRTTPSVAGRITPSLSTSSYGGRITPSFSASTSGRIAFGRSSSTSTNGRVTPGTTPGARAIPKTVNTPKSQLPHGPGSPLVETKFTPGSRASKYASLTAQQLSERESSLQSPTHRAASRTSNSKNGAISTTLVHGSPFNTPKPASKPATLGIGPAPTSPSRPRASLTPRARLPSAIAMPPPPSPSQKAIPSRSAADGSTDDLMAEGRALQDRIDHLMSGKTTPSSPRPGSAASRVSSGPLDGHLESGQLYSQMEALLQDNRRLQQELDSRITIDSSTDSRLAAVQSDRDDAHKRITELEASLRAKDRTLGERMARIEALQRSYDDSATNLTQIRMELESRAEDLSTRLESSETLVSRLKEAIVVKEGAEMQNNAVIQAKDTEIALLASRAQKADSDLATSRQDLGAQVDELRRAGQETIALYEDRLSAADALRFELEDKVAELQVQNRTVPDAKAPSTEASGSTAAQIDNESLQEQVQFLQKRISSLEDMLEDARASSERDEAAILDRVKRYKDREEAIKEELAESRKEIERLNKSETSARTRQAELEEAVRENAGTLESARGEVETLRTELADMERNRPSAASQSVEPDADRANVLQQQLGEVHKQVEELKQQLDLSESERVQMEQFVDDLKLKAEDDGRVLQELRKTIESQNSEMDSLRKTSKHNSSPNGEHTSSVLSPPSPSGSLSAAKEELKGLRILVQQLQKENSSVGQQLKLAESENKILISEAAQLRTELKMLEDTLEQSLLRDEQALSSPDASSADVATLQQNLRDLKHRHEVELEQLRKRLSDMEMKNARTVHDLNKEISELESLVESKIYREDELEREVERLNGKVARGKKSSKPSPDGSESISSALRSESSRSSVSSLASSAAFDPGTEVCEICEQPGHDIFTCKVLAGDEASTKLGSSTRVVCGDCGQGGHSSDECPYAQDVF